MSHQAAESTTKYANDVRTLIRTDRGWAYAQDVVRVGKQERKFLEFLRQFPDLGKGDLTKIALRMGVPPKELWIFSSRLRRKFGAPSNRQLIKISEQLYGRAVPRFSAGITVLEKSKAERDACRAHTLAQLIEIGASVDQLPSKEMAVVRYRGCTVDVWPTTGRWRVRSGGINSFGLTRNNFDELLTLLKNQPETLR